MKQKLIGIAMVSLSFASLAMAAAPIPGADSGPCSKIVAACKTAGFSEGSAGGKDLYKDCFEKVADGKTVNGVPPVDAATLASCKSNLGGDKGGGMGAPAPDKGAAPPKADDKGLK